MVSEFPILICALPSFATPLSLCSAALEAAHSARNKHFVSGALAGRMQPALLRVDFPDGSVQPAACPSLTPNPSGSAAVAVP